MHRQRLEAEHRPGERRRRYSQRGGASQISWPALWWRRTMRRESDSSWTAGQDSTKMSRKRTANGRVLSEQKRRTPSAGQPSCSNQMMIQLQGQMKTAALGSFFILAASLGLAWSPPRTPSKQPPTDYADGSRVFTLGMTGTGNLYPGESHEWTLHLEADRYVEVEFQADIDAVVEVSDPEGQIEAEFGNRPGGVVGKANWITTSRAPQPGESPRG